MSLAFKKELSDLSPSQTEDYYLNNQVNFCYPNEFFLSKALQTVLLGMKKFEEAEVAISRFRHLKYGQDHDAIVNYFQSQGWEATDETMAIKQIKINYSIKFYYFFEGRNAFTFKLNERVEHIKRKREVAVRFLEQAKYKKAIKLLKVIHEFCTLGIYDEDKKELNTFNLSALLNLSLCYWKLKDWVHMKQFSTKALEIDKKNVKAVYRLAFAESAQLNYETALSLLDQHKDVSSDELATLRAETTVKLKEFRAKEKQMYGNIFKHADKE